MPRRISCRIDTSPHDVRYSKASRCSLRSSAFLLAHTLEPRSIRASWGLREARYPRGGRLQVSRCSLRSSALLLARSLELRSAQRIQGDCARRAFPEGEASSKPVLASLVSFFIGTFARTAFGSRRQQKSRVPSAPRLPWRRGGDSNPRYSLTRTAV